MRRLQIKFPSQIRISGWDFGSSARAMNQAGGKDSLMTYENESIPQADLRTVRRSTIERKIMSTKTSIKRIALVAVSALGFGMVTGVAANAAQNTPVATTKVTAITAAQVTATPTTGSAVVVNLGATTVATAAGGAGTDYQMKFSAYVSSYPTGGSTPVSAVATATGTTTVVTGGTNAISANTLTVDGADNAALGGNTVAASSTLGIGSFSFTPSIAGTYVVKIWHDADEDGVVDVAETQNEISVTVVAATDAVVSSTYSTIGAWDATAYSKAAGTTAGNAKTFTIKSTTDAAMNGQTVRAVVKGPGTVSLVGSATVTGRDVSNTLAAGANTATLQVIADGTAGSTTVDVYVGTTLVLTTAAITFYGTLATLKVTQNKSVVAKDTSLAGAVTISGLDADGKAVPLADDTIVGTSSNAAVVLTKTNTEDAVTSGVLTLAVKGANTLATASGSTATITWKYLISGTTYTPDVVTTFTIGGAKNTVSITLDDSSYAPGALVTATIKATDASGNPSADGDVIASGKLTSSLAVQGLTTAAVATVGGKATVTFYAPASGNAFTLTAAYVDASAVDQTATATATLSNVAADAVDAANEATDAANAATDAANAAAEAADAATAAAQDAQAAVAALATQVASLIAGIKAQITTLTNLVIKIQKKVRA